jgi:hypothetical protein
MKRRMLSRLVFIVIAFASVFLVSHSFAYDIADYYPLVQGFSWTYQETENGSTEEYTETIDGSEDVNGVTTKKQVRDDGAYVCLLFDSEALKLYKEVAPRFGYLIYDPPHGYFPAEADIGQTSSYSSGWTLYDLSDSPTDGGTIGSSLTLEAVEDVSVPAGNFPGCLRFYYLRQYNSQVTGEIDIIEGTVYLAPDVGMVKDEYTYQEYDDQGVLVDEWTGVKNLVSYNPSGGGGGGDAGGGGGG